MCRKRLYRFHPSPEFLCRGLPIADRTASLYLGHLLGEECASLAPAISILERGHHAYRESVRQQTTSQSWGETGHREHKKDPIDSQQTVLLAQLTFSSTSAATGRQLKQSVKVFQSLTLYRRLHSS